MSLMKSTTKLSPGGALKAKGHTLRSAAPLLGVHFGHLHKVLQGERHSQRLLTAISELGDRKPQS